MAVQQVVGSSMPLFFLLVGIFLVVVALNDKLPEFGALVKDDFMPSNGSPGFSSWIIAVFVIGSLGYVKTFKPVANSFLALVVIVMFISNRGFFDKFTQALKQG